MLSRWVQDLLAQGQYEGQFVHHQIIPNQPVVAQELPSHLHPRLKKLLVGQGIRKLYGHQGKALALLEKGKDVAVMTPTGSGKSLIYHLAVLQEILKDPNARALYLFPLKALEQDQAQILQEMVRDMGAADDIRVAVYDGDTPQHIRRKLLAKPPNVLISNPDMLHLSFLPGHETLKEFFKNLRFVVVDELSTYRGVFGSHFHQVMKRLHRVLENHGASPRIVCCSATVCNAQEFSRTLMGRDFAIVAENGAPRARRHFLFMNPTASPYTEGANLFVRGIEAGLKTIAFTKARKITELVHTWVLQKAPNLADRISSYRAGYMPEERREIENRLFNDEMDGVISTSALEMGIDIGGLDLCILIGYPGTITSTWQRGGRVGRGSKDSCIVLIGMPDALDQYFMKNPKDFFGRSYEKAIIDTHNRAIVKKHLVCAATEIPLGKRDSQYAFSSHSVPIRELEMTNQLLRSAHEDIWFGAKRRPQRDVDIRSVGEGFTIFEEGEGKSAGKPIGKVAGGRVYSECHPGAIYLHRARQYQVTRLDLEHHNIYVRQSWENYFTEAKAQKETEVLTQDKTRPAGNFLLKLGRLKVTEQVNGYDKKELRGRHILDSHTLEMPPVVFETVGLWMEIEQPIVEKIEARGLHYMGAIHAAEHAMISLFPLFALCDRADVGGISYPMHPHLGKSAIFIYDGIPGGIGLSERCFEVLEQLMEKTLKLLKDCRCQIGCPSCVHSPKCGNGNRPLDKQGAIVLLEYLLGKRSLHDADPLSLRAIPMDMQTDTAMPRIQIKPPSPRVLTFDVETQRSAGEVGGWNQTHLMRVAACVAHDSLTGKLNVYLEGDMPKFIRDLKAADLVVGFNHKRFDYGVLRGYSNMDFSALPNFDILEEVSRRLGHRLSLDHLAQHTLGKAKTADGLQSLRWFKEGKIDLIVEYCKQDVVITRGLFDFGLEKQHLIYQKKAGPEVRLPVDWKLEDILEREGKTKRLHASLGS